MSNKSILDESIFKSVTITNINIETTCKRNLFFGDVSIFRSEKKPIKKIILKNETKVKSFE